MSADNCSALERSSTVVERNHTVPLSEPSRKKSSLVGGGMPLLVSLAVVDGRTPLVDVDIGFDVKDATVELVVEFKMFGTILHIAF